MLFGSEGPDGIKGSKGPVLRVLWDLAVERFRDSRFRFFGDSWGFTVLRIL